MINVRKRKFQGTSRRTKVLGYESSMNPPTRPSTEGTNKKALHML